MSARLPWCLSICLAFGLADSGHSSPLQASLPPSVALESGTVVGEHFGSAPNAAAFLGVPYAAPPVGELRWKPPQPVSRWSGARDATHFGASCPQLPAGWLPTLGWDEDCLFLNVWTPVLRQSGRLPVIVFLHGGGNRAGRSQHIPLGPALAPLGVVVVSANYRLGPFGFLAHPALTGESLHHSSGNYGLLDQLAALSWVHENISRFGGDPDQITVMGHSAGAVDICLLMASPLAAGLFQRAILESGDCQSTLNEDIHHPLAYNSIVGTGEASGESLMADLAIPDGPDALSRLRNVPAQAIMKAFSSDRQMHFDAIVDGWVVPEQPATIFSEGRQLHIPVLVGSTANEATVFAAHGGPRTISEYRNYLFLDAGKYALDEFEAYPATSDAEVPAQYLRLQNDVFGYGARSMARAMTRVGQKAFLYLFSFGGTGKWEGLGAFHGEELMFLSGSFPPDWEYTQDESVFGATMRAYWTQFAKTGNPSAPSLPPWPAYRMHDDQCLELGRTVHTRSVGPQIRRLEDIMRRVLVGTANAQSSSN